MYRTKDFTYLPDYTKDFKNAEELFLFLAQKFDIDAESVDSRQYLRMSILMLAYICQYITNEELSFYFGSYYSSSAIRRALARLVDENMLRSEHFKPNMQQSTDRADCIRVRNEYFKLNMQH